MVQVLIAVERTIPVEVETASAIQFAFHIVSIDAGAVVFWTAVTVEMWTVVAF